ncbi:MAG TPA: rhamnogalacturonan acetylesterase [Flavilitoribacter sp.]|nr:rhamnogalacturonan acetylesterase [Flavilitoribacter sp.]HMQ86775.1 rhamnogalacturonan acetylesterase [Flavilitoribacter sp.]
MKRTIKLFLLFAFSGSFLLSFSFPAKPPVTVYLIGDSTMADYSLESDYMTRRYPITGWGQVFQPFLNRENIRHIAVIRGDSAFVDDRAKGGRSTRTFFEEGRWSSVYKDLHKNDLVIMQFGHNDAAVNKPERYVNVAGYKEYLRLYINQTREKGGIPIVLTPVARNARWADGHPGDVHGEYAQAAKDVAGELNAYLIDLNQLSMDALAEKGQEYVTEHYFMNLPAGEYEAYPAGQKDNTHFQPEGARAMAGLVYEAMRLLK